MDNNRISLVCSDGGWNSGLGRVQIPAQIISTLNFTIFELGLVFTWFSDSAGLTARNSLHSRDLLQSGVSVIIGQTIDVNYQILLS